ncbi:MAG TPA: agmatinase [Firmicutes bacterium]|nr:agmatinase [Bacillota bacterium]
MKTKIQPPTFLAAGTELDQARFCLLGVPLDVTVSFRPGTRRGPEAIRQASWVLEEFSLYQERDLKEVAVADVGDLLLPPGGIKRSLGAIGAAVGKLAQADKIPIILGGEHLLTWPVVEALVRLHGPELTVLQFDAHADLRSKYEGEELSHATALRHVASVVAPSNIYQFGIRSATAEELSYAREHTHFFPFQVVQPLTEVRQNLLNRPVYVSIDMDVFDPAFAPGVGTPEPGGQSVADMLTALQLLKGLNIVGADIVEVCPPFDPSERTAALAALLIRELLLLCD